VTSYPYRYEVTHRIGSIISESESLAAGEGTGTRASVAGRIRTLRTHGKVAFADLEDSSGRIQLFARIDELGDYGMEAFTSLGVGDIVGAAGEIIRTKRGELSVAIEETTLLAPCLRPMPDSWHGVSDVEVRYRQRYLDLIVNPAARVPVPARSAANAAIRSFFVERDFLEVETPLLQPVAGGAVARPFRTHHNALDIDLYLRVAPELYLKRLLIGGFDRVFELNRSFRNEGISTQHNPEFTMLEAYEAFVDWQDTMALVEDLTRTVARAVTGGLVLKTAAGDEIDLGPLFARTTMFEAIARATDRDLTETWAASDVEGLKKAAVDLGVDIDPDATEGKILLDIFEATVEKSLMQPTFVMGFPKDVSPLAKDHRSIPRFSEQSDLIIAGVEIAPIYSELNDPDEQRRRFEQQASLRAKGDVEIAIPDEDFLEALAYGMPPAGGFGFGVDRFLMIALSLPSLREVIMFPTLRPEH
jgi:lysyl-tRNA synthetase, class II